MLRTINQGILQGNTAIRQVAAGVITADRNNRTVTVLGTNVISSAINTNGASITGAINAGVIQIVSALSMGGMGGGGGGGGGSSGGYMSSGGMMGASLSDFPSYAEGGFVPKPTFAMIGDSPGGEWMVPSQTMDSLLSSVKQSVSVGMHLSSDDLTNELQTAIQSLSIPPVRVPVRFDLDSNGLREVMTSIMYDVLEGVRL